MHLSQVRGSPLRLRDRPALEQKMDDGFEASKIDDEKLRGLMTFGLEARAVLRDEMHLRFDAAGHEYDEQIVFAKGRHPADLTKS